MTEGRDKWWDEECAKVPTFCPCEPMNSEDPLFILYVSPPGVVLSKADEPLDVWIHWQAKGCRPLHWWIPAGRSFDGQVRL